MVSTTGRLSTTLHLIPYCSIYSLRSRIFSRVHTSPLGTSCKAVTMPSTPICFNIDRVILSFLPNHLHVLSILLYMIRYSHNTAMLVKIFRKDTFLCAYYHVKSCD